MSSLSHFSSVENVLKARDEIKKDGFYLVQNAYPVDFCRSIIEFVDNYKPQPGEFGKNYKGAEMHYGGSELRIWDAQMKSPLLDVFYRESNQVMSQIKNQDEKAFTLLAIRNNQLQSFDDSMMRGRWHLDSYFKQLKIFLFLSDTTEQSGPFEFLPGTQRSKFKLKNLLSGKYLRPGDILSGGRRAYQKLDDNWVQNLQEKGYKTSPVICRAGTLAIVDTSTIHRARPCIQGSRYALSAYFK